MKSAGAACILADDPGLGKTLATLALTRKMDSVLVVSPKTAKDNWYHESEKWQLNGQLKVIEGSSKAIRQKRLNEAISSQVKYIAIHYDMLVEDKFPQLFSTKWDCVLFDEAHYMKSREQRDSNTGKLKGGRNHSEAKKLKATQKIFMTGTPFTNNAGDCWSMLNMIDPKRFASYWTFVNHFANVGENYFGTTVKGLNDLHAEDLKWLLSRYMIRREKDIESKKVFKYHNLKFGDKQKEVYETAKKNYIYGNNIIESDIERFIRLLQISTDPAILGIDAPSVTNDKILELVGIHEKDKIIIGCVNVEHVVNLNRILAATGRNVFVVTGEAKNKKDIVDRFKSSQGGSILIATITSITESLSIDECDIMILADLTFSPTKNYQFFNRIHRLTSTKDKTYHVLITPDVNEHKQDLLRDKQYMIDALTKGESYSHELPSDLQKYLMQKIKNSS
jgi:SNF2 family DNA or RNA helicase